MYVFELKPHFGVESLRGEAFEMPSLTVVRVNIIERTLISVGDDLYPYRPYAEPEIGKYFSSISQQASLTHRYTRVIKCRSCAYIQFQSRLQSQSQN